jgi:hypothetical protein
MEIDRITNEWFDLLETKLHDVSDKNEVQSHCLLAIVISKNYSNTILQLIEQNKNIQAKVLLRSFAEIVIKTCWCIKDAQGKIEEYYNKNQRLSKSSLQEQIKFLKRAYECFDDQQIKANLQLIEMDLSKLSNVKYAPDDMGLCKELFNNNAQLYYHIIFGQLHQVVHSELAWLQKLKISDKGELYEEGEDKDILVKMCISCIYLLLEYIFKYYCFDFSEIKSEYENIKDS